MDPLTHGLLGSSLGYTLLGRKLGRHAAGIGALAGVAPDVDHFVSSNTDPLLYVEFHRYFTHSIFFAAFGALICALPWLASPRFRPQWRSIWLCALVGYLSHCLLDASTTWGTQLYWPFSRARAAWDIIAIVDPLFTLPLLATLIVALARKRQRAAFAGLTFGLFYLAAGMVQHERAQRAQAHLAAARGHRIERTEVMPTIGNNVVWRSLYLADGQIYSDRIRAGWFTRTTVREGSSLPLATHDSLKPDEAEGNRVHRGFDRFAWFASGWVARSPKEADVIGDMRYSLSAEGFEPVWGIRFTTVGDRPRIEWVSREGNRRIDMHGLWAEIVGRDQRFSKR